MKVLVSNKHMLPEHNAIKMDISKYKIRNRDNGKELEKYGFGKKVGIGLDIHPEHCLCRNYLEEFVCPSISS